ncbi:expressed unknown protein [Seminavis robusta]|uniref:Uncharacterized protein n=1 Tax=Seminavis robusta TaxID=568900 RepID=A0A9N8DYA5_9STRA|nr:expressed unknown protein [Seminavis robusta]|eukprot:Sro442_g143890.1 n/a (909) ;mRNA; r:28735-31584
MDDDDDETTQKSHDGGSAKKRQGRPSNSIVWENVHLESIELDDGTTTVMQQTCVHCNKVNRANKPQTTWWAVHLVDRGPKGCPKAPNSVRHAILNTTSSQQVRDAGMGLMTNHTAASQSNKQKGRKGMPPIPIAGVKRGLSKLLEDNIVVEQVSDGNISQTCRHCKKNRTCKQTLATVWSKHFVDISAKGCPDAPFYVRRAIAAESSSAEVKRLAESQGWLVEVQGNAYSNSPGVTVNQNRSAEEDDQKPRTPKRAKTNNDTCSEPLDGCCQAQADSISMKIMEFLSACGHSMLLIQSPVFLDLLRSLNQAYVDRYLGKADVFVKTWLPKLFQSVQVQLENLWNDQQRKQQALATLGLWGAGKQHSSSSGPTGKIFTETLQENKIAFWGTVTGESEEGVTASGVAQLLASHMISKAEGDESKVTDTYGAVVVTTDDELNAQVGNILQERFPLLFVNRCRLQTILEIRDGIFAIPEIARAYSDAQFIAHFIRDHPAVSEAYHHANHASGESMPVPAASQDFEQVMELMESVVGIGGNHEHGDKHNINTERFLALTRDNPLVSASTETGPVDPQLVQRFEALVSNANTFARFQALGKLLRPLALFEKHLQRPDVRASWIYPVFHALLLDVKEWCSSEDVKLAFPEEETFDQLLNGTLQRCWRGEPGRPGLFSPQLLMAMLLDPTTCPNSDNLPDDWDNDSEEVLKRFYSGKQLLDAQAELMTLLDHQGKFGREVDRYQEALKTVAPFASHCRLNVQQVVDRQMPAVDMKPHLAWKLSLKSSFPLLRPIASRVLVMGSASVETGWASKLDKALNSIGAHHQASPVLAENTVLMLLYCHLNLRSIQRSKSSDHDAGILGISSFEEFLGQALLDNTDAPMPVVEQSDCCAGAGGCHDKPDSGFKLDECGDGCC